MRNQYLLFIRYALGLRVKFLSFGHENDLTCLRMRFERLTVEFPSATFRALDQFIVVLKILIRLLFRLFLGLYFLLFRLLLKNCFGNRFWVGYFGSRNLVGRCLRGLLWLFDFFRRLYHDSTTKAFLRCIELVVACWLLLLGHIFIRQHQLQSCHGNSRPGRQLRFVDNFYLFRLSIPWSCIIFLFLRLRLEGVIHFNLADPRANKCIPCILLAYIDNDFVLGTFFSFSMLAPRSILPLSILIAVREFVNGLVGS